MGPFGLFLTGQGVLALAALAALVVLLWDWRVALAALFVIQVGVAALAVGIEQVPGQAMLVQTLIIFLCCIMLATSGIQVHMRRGGRQSGGWLFRLLVLGLLAAALLSLDLSFALPEVSPAIAWLFGWLGLLALVMLSLGDNPLFTSVGLLLWCVLGYALAALYVPVPGVLILIGLMELVVGLTCSYLILAERLPRLRTARLLTDVDFPSSDLPPAEPLPLPRLPVPHPLARPASAGQGAVSPQTRAAPQGQVTATARPVRARGQLVIDTLSGLNLPAILLMTLAATAAITYVLRDWERATALAAAAVTGLIGLVVWRFDAAVSVQGDGGESLLAASPTLSRFGFTLQFHGDMLPALVLVFFMATAALLLAARFPQGHGFVPMTSLLLAGYSAWYMVTAGPIATALVLPLGLVILAACSAVALQAGRSGQVGGPLRWLVAPVLAFPLFLVASWYVEQDSFGITTGSPERTAAALMTFGLLLLMAPVPLHSLQPATAESAPPMATALLTLLYQLALIFLISHVVIEFPFMQTLAPMNIWFSWAGLVTAIWAGLAAIGATHPGRLWGYLALHDWGLIILLLSVPGLRTWSLVAFLFVLRVVSVMGAAAGLMAIEHYVGDLGSERLEGAGVRLPWNTAVFLLGGLGLVGFPLSAGFAGHWAALQLVAASDWRPAGAVVVASGAAILALIRMARILYGPQADPSIPRERALGIATAVLVMGITVLLAVAPQLLNGPVSRAIVAFGT